MAVEFEVGNLSFALRRVRSREAEPAFIFHWHSRCYGWRVKVQNFSTTASSSRTGLERLSAGGIPRSRRRFCAQVASVGYLTPTTAANFFPLNPLRSNSSSICSRRAAGVCIRPSLSVFNTASSALIISVISRQSMTVMTRWNRGPRRDAYHQAIDWLLL